MQDDDNNRIKESFGRIRQNFYRGGAKVMVNMLYRMKYIGFEKIPKHGPAILISNHVSYMDGVVIDSAVERPVRYIIDREIFNWPFVYHFMSLYRAIPIEPSRESVEAALTEAEKALRNGELVFIFPEGQLSHTGNMRRFRYGIEWLLKRYPVPVYPIAIKGLWGSILSRKYKHDAIKFIPRDLRRRVTLICGDPIPPEIATVGYMQRVVMSLTSSISNED